MKKSSMWILVLLPVCFVTVVLFVPENQIPKWCSGKWPKLKKLGYDVYLPAWLKVHRADNRGLVTEWLV